jgi:hypothetical protein
MRSHGFLPFLSIPPHEPTVHSPLRLSIPRIHIERPPYLMSHRKPADRSNTRNRGRPPAARFSLLARAHYIVVLSSPWVRPGSKLLSSPCSRWRGVSGDVVPGGGGGAGEGGPDAPAGRPGPATSCLISSLCDPIGLCVFSYYNDVSIGLCVLKMHCFYEKKGYNSYLQQAHFCIRPFKTIHCSLSIGL